MNSNTITAAIEATPVALDLALAGRALEATSLLTSIEGISLELALSLVDGAHTSIVAAAKAAQVAERIARINYNIDALIAEGVDAHTAQIRANRWG